ncbi:MAG: hypothetical protein AB7P31_00510 [Steroidobacteraceae bacterium]
MNSPPRFKDALEVFARHDVELIVVGGVAAVIGGVPLATFDLDVVHARDAANLDRLQRALEDLDARYRDPGGRTLRPDVSSLAGAGHHLLMTRCGPVDVLGSIGRGRNYEVLLPHALAVQLGGLTIRVLGLEVLIQTKEEAGRDKDRAALELLRRALRNSKEPQ